MAEETQRRACCARLNSDISSSWLPGHVISLFTFIIIITNIVSATQTSASQKRERGETVCSRPSLHHHSNMAAAPHLHLIKKKPSSSPSLWTLEPPHHQNYCNIVFYIVSGGVLCQWDLRDVGPPLSPKVKLTCIVSSCFVTDLSCG